MSASPSGIRTFVIPGAFPLESGAVLHGVTAAWRSWGALDRDRANAVVVCHGLTANADADEWWAPLFGRGRALDPERDFIVCSNVLGSCYGTSGPASVDPLTGTLWGARFPRVTIRDMVRAQRALVSHLGIRRIRLVLGGSLGGMQTLEWALAEPQLVEAIAPIATTGRHSPWAIALGEAQRHAIFADSSWRGGAYAPSAPPAKGLAAARMIAMASYRAHAGFAARFGRERDADGFAVESWLRAHGERLVRRFDANAYVRLTEAMDTHDVARGRGDYTEVLGSIRQPALVVSIDSDILYPPAEQQELAALIPEARLQTIRSLHGHDGFLVDAAAVNDAVLSFRRSLERQHPVAAAVPRKEQRCAS
jgi:homoserine O-acetyltransferase/O-succinyltransferase